MAEGRFLASSLHPKIEFEPTLSPMTSARGFLRRMFDATSELNRQVILECSPRRPGGTLLDLGCGDGGFTRRFGASIGAARLLGVELIDHLARAAERNGVEVTQANLAEPLPFEDASVDVIHSNQVIEHLAGTDLFMSEIRRLLRPGGYAIVSTNNLASLHNILALMLGWQPWTSHVSDEITGLGNPVGPHGSQEASAGATHLRIFTGRALADLARHHGLRVELQRTSGFYPLAPWAARVANRVFPLWGAYLVQRYAI
jgi:SAM-dependent methyltransferase